MEAERQRNVPPCAAPALSIPALNGEHGGTEVAYLHAVISRQQQVLRLDVPVHDAHLHTRKYVRTYKQSISVTCYEYAPKHSFTTHHSNPHPHTHSTTHQVTHTLTRLLTHPLTYPLRKSSSHMHALNHLPLTQGLTRTHSRTRWHTMWRCSRPSRASLKYILACSSGKGFADPSSGSKAPPSMYSYRVGVGVGVRARPHNISAIGLWLRKGPHVLL